MNKNLNEVSYTDTELLVKRFQGGDIKAFDEIAVKYRKAIYKTAYDYTKNYEDAYDISQEVLIKAFMSLSNLRESSVFSLWLSRITVNTCIDFLRHQPENKALDIALYINSDFVSTRRDLPDRILENVELRNVIDKAIEQLPNKQKSVFMLRHYKDLSLDKIAETLKCPVGTAKANLFHATRNLRKQLLLYMS